jgi:hypothetical protein
MDSLSAKSQDALDYEHRTARPGRSNPNNLRDQIAVDEGMRTWATPTVNNSKNNAGPSQMDRHGPALDVQVAQYPTPLSSDATGSRSSKGTDRPDEGGLLHAAKTTDTVGMLNADWVEWLMGVPQGWSIAEPWTSTRSIEYDMWLRQQLAASHWLEEQGLPRTIVSQENRVSRLKMLGNGIVPSAAAIAIKELSARLL